MSPKLKEFLQRWAITTLAVLAAAYVVRDIHYDHWSGLLVTSLLLGIFNAFLRPLLLLATVGVMGLLNMALGFRVAVLTLPLQIVLFGFLLLAINAALLMLASNFVPSFHVDEFWTAFKGGLVISVASLILNSLTGTGNARIQVHRGKPRSGPGSRNDDGGQGPVIDV